MIYFLLHGFRRNLRSAVIVGMFMAFIGAQIQFFIFAGIFLALFLLWNRDKVNWKYFPIMFGIPALINLVWLMNFLDGGASATQTGAVAAQVSFSASSESSFLNIFTFNFSQATLLSKFYEFYELLWNAALFVFMFWLLAHGRKKQQFDTLLLIFLAIMFFLATGMYQLINLGPLTAFYPMLREVGHFAPVIVLTALLLTARLLHTTRWRWVLTLVLVGSLVIVGVKFQYYSQGYSFTTARQNFSPFKQIADSDTSTYRVLAYPFFNKYVTSWGPQTPNGVFPLQNAGNDSFSVYATQAFLSNDIAPYQFQSSVQNQLLQTYNIDVLRPYNVKYIFDFSKFYQSDYNFYVPSSTYDNNMSLIKNDPDFLDKLMQHNPGQLKRINADVVEITDYTPRAYSPSTVFSGVSSSQANSVSLFTRQELNKPLDYISGTLPATLEQFTSHITTLFNSHASSDLNKTAQTFTQNLTIPTSSSAKLYVSQAYRSLSYTTTGNVLRIYAEPVPPLLVNNQPTTQTSTTTQLVGQLTLTPGTTYYISFDGSTVPVTMNSSGSLGTGKAGDGITVIGSKGSNMISDPSFETGLWQQRVGDCNDYDNHPDISMSRDTTTASVGKASLELSATRHDACTSQDITLDANTEYALSFDYQGVNAQTASFYLGNIAQNTAIVKGSEAIVDTNWHTATTTFRTGSTAVKSRLFLYALEGDGTHATIDRYDNVRLYPLTKQASFTVPTPAETYTETDLQSGTQTFTFKDSNYTYQNLIANPSFAEGSWEAKVDDCNNYDNNPVIGMSLDPSQKTVGTQSLQLSATRHDACVHTMTNVVSGSTYLLNFDYEVAAGTTYGYAVSYDDPNATLDQQKLTAVAGSGWHTASVNLQVPQGATTLTLYLYAYQGNGHTADIDRYDNVSLVQLPVLSGRFYVVQQPTAAIAAPSSTSFAMVSQSVRTVNVHEAMTPFFVALSESYHPKWQLELDNSSVDGLINSWSPGAGAVTTGIQHITLDDAINGWLVDPKKLCQSGQTLRQGCTQNADGSYNIALKAEFLPQRWFAVGTVISWTTIAVCVVYLVRTRGRKDPTYRSSRE